MYLYEFRYKCFIWKVRVWPAFCNVLRATVSFLYIISSQSLEWLPSDPGWHYRALPDLTCLTKTCGTELPFLSRTRWHRASSFPTAAGCVVRSCEASSFSQWESLQFLSSSFLHTGSREMKHVTFHLFSFILHILCKLYSLHKIPSLGAGQVLLLKSTIYQIYPWNTECLHKMKLLAKVTEC